MRVVSLIWLVLLLACSTPVEIEDDVTPTPLRARDSNEDVVEQFMGHAKDMNAFADHMRRVNEDRIVDSEEWAFICDAVDSWHAQYMATYDFINANREDLTGLIQSINASNYMSLGETMDRDRRAILSMREHCDNPASRKSQ